MSGDLSTSLMNFLSKFKNILSSFFVGASCFCNRCRLHCDLVYLTVPVVVSVLLSSEIYLCSLASTLFLISAAKLLMLAESRKTRPTIPHTVQNRFLFILLPFEYTKRPYQGALSWIAALIQSFRRLLFNQSFSSTSILKV